MDRSTSPKSAYFLWLSINKEDIIAANPGLNASEIENISGKLWMQQTDKTPWEKIVAAADATKEYVSNVDKRPSEPQLNGPEEKSTEASVTKKTGSMDVKDCGEDEEFECNEHVEDDNWENRVKQTSNEAEASDDKPQFNDLEEKAIEVSVEEKIGGDYCSEEEDFEYDEHAYDDYDMNDDNWEIEEMQKPNELEASDDESESLLTDDSSSDNSQNSGMSVHSYDLVRYVIDSDEYYEPKSDY